MIDRTAIQPNMEVYGSDGTIVGRVASMDGDAFRLATAGAGGVSTHLIPFSAVSGVDRAVHLSVTAAGIAGVATTISSPHRAGPASDKRSGGGAGGLKRYLPWILGGILLLLFLILAVRSCQPEEREVRDREDSEQVADRRGGDEERTERARGNYAEGSMAAELDRFLASDEPVPRTLTFERLNFAEGSAGLRAEDAGDLDQMAQVLNEHRNARVAIIGYTDARGSGRANAQLGQARAEAIAEALTIRGIARDRVQARTGGEQAPIADNDDAEGRAENRRTELIVVAR